MRTKTGKKRIMMVCTLALLLAAAGAQEFVFSSNRIRAEPETGPSGSPLTQNELFLYRDGSQLRLTFSPTENEWDPQPSPSGRFIAYFVTDTIIDWAADDLPETWNWSVRIMDVESRLILEEWLIPGAAGTTRIAGGFDLAWYADESALLAQAFDENRNGRIVKLEVGNADSAVHGRGLGVHLQPETGWYATMLDDFVTVVDPVSGNEYPLETGEPLGWHGSQVVVGGSGPLVLMNPISAERTVLDTDEDYYPVFATSPDGSRHAWIGYAQDSTGTVVTVVDREFQPVSSWLHHDFVDSLVWMDEESLLLNGLLGDNLAVTEVRVADNAEFVLVATTTDNMNVRMMSVTAETGSPEPSQ